MSVDELEVVNRFLAVLATAAATGHRDPLLAFLAADVEWVTPQRVLRGIEQVREELTWLAPPDNLDVEFERGETTGVGDGRFAVEAHEIYRVKGSGDFAYARDRRVEVTIGEGKVIRYEMRIVG